MTRDGLTVERLEGSGYSHAASLLEAGDRAGAARAVLSEPGPYSDSEDAAVRRLAAALAPRRAVTRDGLLTFLCAAAIVIGAAGAGLVFLWVLATLLFILAG